MFGNTDEHAVKVKSYLDSSPSYSTIREASDNSHKSLKGVRWCGPLESLWNYMKRDETLMQPQSVDASMILKPPKAFSQVP